MPDNEMKAGMRLEDSDGRMTSGMHESGAHPAREGTASDSEGGGATHEHGLDWREIVRIGFVAIAAGTFWFLGVHPSFPLVLGGVICAVVGGYPIFREAIENILERRMTMELSMAIAILAALAIREVFTALVITLFVLVAEVLEGFTVGRGRRAIRHLIDLLPSTATVNERGGWREVGVQQVQVGDIVLIKP